MLLMMKRLSVVIAAAAALAGCGTGTEVSDGADSTATQAQSLSCQPPLGSCLQNSDCCNNQCVIRFGSTKGYCHTKY